MAKKKASAPRPRRTREHVIASQSLNYVEKFFIDKGHTAKREVEDYGIDLLIKTFDENGYAESGELLIQLKASDGLAYSTDHQFISHTIKVEHYELWTRETMPVFLVLYDALQARAYWLYVQEYFAADLTRQPKAGAKTRTVRVPTANELIAEAVDVMRARKATILAQIEGKLEHHG